MRQILRAIIYVLDGPRAEAFEQRCADWCQRLGYRIVAIVRDDPEHSRWPDVAEMIWGREIDVVVVAERSHRPVDAVPRIEVVAEERRRRIPLI